MKVITSAPIYYKKDLQSNLEGNSINILKKWKDNIDSRNLDATVNTYSENAILVSTFGDIIKGREGIKNYFQDLFKKDKLKVEYIEKPFINTMDKLTMYTGIYQFSYIENGKPNFVKARYSIISKPIAGKQYIVKQHSSEVPN